MSRCQLVVALCWEGAAPSASIAACFDYNALWFAASDRQSWAGREVSVSPGVDAQVTVLGPTSQPDVCVLKSQL